MSTEQAPPPDPAGAKRRRGALDLRILGALAVVVVIAGGVALLTSGKGSRAGVASVKSAKYDGSLASPPAPAPPLALRNYNGEPVDIARDRGKAVLITFIYTHCPDVCPLIASNLGIALHLMPPELSSKVRVIAVSVDARGDTPETVRRFLTQHLVLGQMQYLLGNLRQLARVWKAWGVGSERDAQQPQLVNHSGIVYGVSASGKVTTVYASNFTPAEIAHDARLLAAA